VRAKKTLCIVPLGAPTYPFGQVTKYCTRPDLNGPNQIDSDTKMGRPAKDAMIEQRYIVTSLRKGLNTHHPRQTMITKDTTK
jgi:hypothetical protein